ncbi:MAG: DnaJ domain-containing protein [Cyclobacteriaceae bacterium]
MNQYLEILELQAGVTEADIKKAYRRLAKKYHPDISKDPEAERKFIAITEAYNFLMEVGSRPHQEEIRYDYNPMAREYDERRRKAREYAREKQRRVMEQRYATLAMVYHYCNYFVGFVLALNLLLILDYFLPEQKTREQVMGITYSYETNKPYSQNLIYRHGIIHFEQHDILVDSRLLDNQLLNQWTGISPEAEISSTLLLDIVSSAHIRYEGHSLRVQPVYSIYQFFFFLIPAILIFSVLYFQWSKTSDNKIGLVLLLLVFFIIQLLVYFSSN